MSAKLRDAEAGSLALDAAGHKTLAALLSREGITRVAHLRVLTMEDLLAVGVQRLHARLIVAALQQ